MYEPFVLHWADCIRFDSFREQPFDKHVLDMTHKLRCCLATAKALKAPGRIRVVSGEPSAADRKLAEQMVSYLESWNTREAVAVATRSVAANARAKATAKAKGKARAKRGVSTTTQIANATRNFYNVVGGGFSFDANCQLKQKSKKKWLPRLANCVG